MNIAFLTCEKVPELVPSDKRVADYLIEQNCPCSPIIWNDPNIQLKTFDALILRSVWDYHILYDQWTAFLDRLEAEKFPTTYLQSEIFTSVKRRIIPEPSSHDQPKTSRDLHRSTDA